MSLKCILLYLPGLRNYLNTPFELVTTNKSLSLSTLEHILLDMLRFIFIFLYLVLKILTIRRHFDCWFPIRRCVNSIWHQHNESFLLIIRLETHQRLQLRWIIVLRIVSSEIILSMITFQLLHFNHCWIELKRIFKNLENLDEWLLKKQSQRTKSE